MPTDDPVGIGTGVIFRVEVKEERVTPIEGIENIYVKAMLDFGALFGITKTEVKAAIIRHAKAIFSAVIKKVLSLVEVPYYIGQDEGS